jgi:hypothetical protein
VRRYTPFRYFDFDTKNAAAWQHTENVWDAWGAGRDIGIAGFISTNIHINAGTSKAKTKTFLIRKKQNPRSGVKAPPVGRR